MSKYVKGTFWVRKGLEFLTYEVLCVSPSELYIRVWGYNDTCNHGVMNTSNCFWAPKTFLAGSTPVQSPAQAVLEV